MAIDFHNPYQQVFPSLSVNLANDEECLFLHDLLKRPGAVFYVHASPPSPPQAEGHGEISVKQLLYENIIRLLQVALQNGAKVCLENPLRSKLWSMECVKALVEQYNLFPVDFQPCAWGGQRNIWLRCYVNFPEFRSLGKRCNGQHEHFSRPAADGQLSLKHSEYPPILCQTMAAAIAECARNSQLQPHTAKKQKFSTASALRAAEAGRQPRGNRLPQILSEFKYECVIQIPATSNLKPRQLTQQECHDANLSFPAKLLEKMGCEGDKDFAHKESSGFVQVKVGVYRTPDEFLQDALRLEHPFDTTALVEDDVKRNIFTLLTKGPKAIDKWREEVFLHYEKVAQDLSQKEEQLHAAIPPHREQLVKNKKFLLFQRMCSDAGILDNDFVELQAQGAQLVGNGVCTSLFREDHVPAAMSRDNLMKASKWTRRRILGRKAVQVDSELCEEIWRLSMDEVSKGWLSGPYEEQQLSEVLGPLFVTSRRFGIRQADKVRPIDDMTDSLVNSAFSQQYKLDLPGIDGVALSARTILEAVSKEGVVCLKLSDGSRLKGLLHPSLKNGEARRIIGRTLDLEAAYKQMLVSEKSLWASVLSVDDPDGKQKLFISHVLPFGASASVYAFNKMAKALHVVGMRLFGLVWSQYYDDYPQLDLAKSGDSGQRTAERFLDLVGWQYSCKTSKRRSASRVFDVLGVTFDFSHSEQGLFHVKNKESRVEQIVQQIDDILCSNFLPMSVAASLRGRVQFAEAQTFGRVLAANIGDFGGRVTGKLPGNRLTEGMKNDLMWMRTFVLGAEPRVLRANMSDRRIVVFTDAALEGDNCGSIGLTAYVVGPCGVSRKFYFSSKVPTTTLEALQSRTRKIISTLELLAAIFGVRLLGPLFCGFRFFVFVDNEAARASLISQYSPLESHNRQLRVFARLVQKHSLFVWIARVPSASNPSDKPSRSDLSEIDDSFTQLEVPWDEALASV